MQIACPACHTRYSVPDTAIGAKGRTVRCAKCRHSWYQAGSEEAIEAEGPPPVDTPEDAPAPPADPAPMAEGWDEQPEAEEPTVTTEVEDAPSGFSPREGVTQQDEVFGERPSPATYEEVVIEETIVTETVAEPYEEPEPVDAEYEDLDTPRRGAGRIVVICLVLLVLAAAGIYGAVRYFGAPDWLPVGQTTFGAPSESLVLDFSRDDFDHKDLPNGRQLVATSGTITNTGTKIERVPPILVVLRDSQDRIVYSWEIDPPKSELGPGESVKVSEMVTDVPRSAQDITIGWKPS
ncbi:zinc-ribbon domain-containing protein [Croceicoccus mobilis]|uniref:Zinc finger/thioredoxin putative domain-containing protein n=1 Tax=Croceicoccus mobilis TaxID=1703339 RepID=A0A917DUN8_9SPHN|nr:zinc-ribbon domain-containing protein [Croceicoccus mobilis]GGD72112.1 hypothetical protein GCM10010990_21970 [Croceicoccus mobilis]